MHCMFEYSEVHFQSLLLNLNYLAYQLSHATCHSHSTFQRQVAKIKETLGDLWPDKGFIKHEQSDDCKAALHEVKGQILEQLAETDEEKAEYELYWPFE